MIRGLALSGSPLDSSGVGMSGEISFGSIKVAFTVCSKDGCDSTKVGSRLYIPELDGEARCAGSRSENSARSLVRAP